MSAGLVDPPADPPPVEHLAATSQPPGSAFSHERAIQLLTWLAGLPGALTCLVLLWTGDFSLKVAWTLSVLVTGVWVGSVLAVRERIVYPMQTLTNLLGALREGDYSLRSRRARRDDALGEVMREINALGATLQSRRREAMEASALLRAVMAELDVAVFTIDAAGCLRLVNRAGAALLGRPEAQLVGQPAEAAGLAEALGGQSPRTLSADFPGRSGARWSLRRSEFRAGGQPQRLLVLADVSQPLREEERAAWQRLIRVLGHEINNSLAPIGSIAESLATLLDRPEDRRAHDWLDDTRGGLGTIAARAQALGRFMGAYSRLARLPTPDRQPLELGALVRRAAALETRLPVAVDEHPPVMVRADGDQLEQALINLIRNAADAALETGGGVRAGWSVEANTGVLTVEDDGPGLSDTANLFVPFFTTKPQGSGIGLVLSRQIAEAHGGTLHLERRPDGQRGCRATLRVPL